MQIEFKTKGTCSSAITIDVEDGVVRKVRFTGGCNGNLKGLSRLVEGMKAEEVIGKLKGTTCGLKKTSCPDQLAMALEQSLQKQ